HAGKQLVLAVVLDDVELGLEVKKCGHAENSVSEISCVVGPPPVPSGAGKFIPTPGAAAARFDQCVPGLIFGVVMACSKVMPRCMRSLNADCERPILSAHSGRERDSPLYSYKRVGRPDRLFPVSATGGVMASPSGNMRWQRSRTAT